MRNIKPVNPPKAGITASELEALVPDMPSGPLDLYRKRSRVNWKTLRLSIEDPEFLSIKSRIWKALEQEKEFQHSPVTLGVEDQKRRTMKQLMKFHTLKHDILTPEIMSSNYIRKTKHLMAMNEALCLFDRNLSVKFALGVSLFGSMLPRLGKEYHLKYGEKAWQGELLGCVAITEIAHGSNTKKLRTTATYDPNTKEFVIHTPDFEAAKCWVGNLGRTSTYAVVFAQLITADGENHGLHGFIVPIRDPQTLLPYPGITVGDMGEKNGLNGIDNGFIIFDHYRIPKENLMNKTGDVNGDGEYESSFTDPAQILGAALETLNTGRVGITQEATVTLCSAVTIAIRYAAVRRQFGPGNEEIPILEYPLHQWRLFPYLAASVMFRIFVIDFVDQYLTIIDQSNSSTVRLSDFSAVVSEIHAIVSSCKPLVTWICRDALQECREACGGHGYLKAANLGELRTNHDPSVTYEGDNNVLIQQTSNWLLRQATTDRGESRNSPFATTKFLDHYESVLNYKFVGTTLSDVLDEKFVIGAFEWLLCWLIRETDLFMSEVQSQGADKFTARAHAQLYKARTLSLAFAENNALLYAWRRINRPGLDPDVKTILKKLYLIYGLWCIDKHLTYFYQGGFCEGPNLASLVREGLVLLCSEIVPDAVAIVDAISPPDFILNSVLACSDGKLYDNLKNQLLNQPGAMERATWWKDAIPFPQSKL